MLAKKIGEMNRICLRIIRITCFLLFINGIVFGTWALIGLNIYFKSNCDNRLPPAGEFIDGPASFTFAIVSDSGMRTTPFREVIKSAKNRDIKFILHLGDLAGDFSSNHFEHMLQDIDKFAGDTSFFAVPGNHDVISSHTLSYNFYKRAFGQPYYWFSYGDTLFVMLDTATSDFSSKQQVWLKNVLDRMRPLFKTCLVCMHVPPQDPRPGKSYSMERDIDELRMILEKHRITAIFAGHIHEYLKSEFAGAPIYILPPSGQEMRGDTTMFGYLLCKFDKSGVLNVEKIDVTDDRNRDIMADLLSTGLDGITSTYIALSSFAVAFLLCFFLGNNSAREKT